MTTTRRVWLGVTAIVCMMFFAQSSALAKPEKLKTYPERGTVIDSYAQPKGKRYTGKSMIKVTPIYRVETDKTVYEIENKKETLTLGDIIEFRIDKDSVYVREGNKEKKFRLVDTEPKPPALYK